MVLVGQSLSLYVVVCLVRLPPSIVQSPVKEIIYQQDTEVQLDCVAEGTPEPRYCTLISLCSHSVVCKVLLSGLCCQAIAYL